MEEDINHIFLDLDSTVWYWDEFTSEAEDALKSLNRMDKDLRFFTDNTLLTSEGYAKKLTSMGLNVDESQIFGVERVLENYLVENSINEAYVVGNSSFIDFLSEHIEINQDSENVIIGFDQQLNYQKLDRAFQIANNGGKIITCSNEKLFRKGNNNHLHQQFVNKTLGQTPNSNVKYLGKGSKRYRKEFKDFFAYFPTNSLMVGDSKEDVYLGNHLGMTTVLTTTGNMKRHDFKDLEGMEEPDYGLSHLGRLKKRIF